MTVYQAMFCLCLHSLGSNRRGRTFVKMENLHGNGGRSFWEERVNFVEAYMYLCQGSSTVMQQTAAESVLFALLTRLTFPTWLVQMRNYMWKSSVPYGIHHRCNTLSWSSCPPLPDLWNDTRTSVGVWNSTENGPFIFVCVCCIACWPRQWVFPYTVRQSWTGLHAVLD